MYEKRVLWSDRMIFICIAIVGLVMMVVNINGALRYDSWVYAPTTMGVIVDRN